MGQIPFLTKEQAVVLDSLGSNAYISGQGYFTGGTALSSFYLQHRASEDIDIFSEKPWDSQELLRILTGIAGSKGRIRTRYVDPVHIYTLTFPGGATLKVDINTYPYPRLAKSDKRIGNLPVDSLVDIAANKLLAVTQRTEVKDFVDLYFLLQTYTFWDLKEAVAQKFRVDIDPMLIGQDYLAVEEFTFLPQMHKPLTLDELKAFFREEAVRLGKSAVE